MLKLAQQIAINYFRAKLNLIGVISKKKAARQAFELFTTPFRRSNKKYPRIFNRAEKLEFDLDGSMIRGFRFNHPASHKILIVHGFESSARNFDRYIGPLVRKGYEILAFDGPAHGRSDGKRITIPQYRKMLEEACNRYGPINGFLAHSFGGLALAHLLEGLPHDEQTKVVWVAPAAETVTAIDSFFRFLDLGDDIRKEFDQYILEKSGHPPDYFSIKRTLPAIKAKVLWIHDEEDEITPLADAQKVKELGSPQIQFHFTKGLGHRRIYKENKIVKMIVDFL